MGRESVHRAWAEALFEIAKGAGKVPEFEEGLEVVAAQLKASPELRTFATTPRISTEDKQALMGKVFDGKLEPQLVHALQLAAQRRRLVELPGIAKAYRLLADEAEGRQRVRVTSAVELDDAARESVTKAVAEKTGKTVLLEEKVDANLIAGLIIEYGDVRIDGSMRRRLRLFLRDAYKAVRRPVGE